MPTYTVDVRESDTRAAYARNDAKSWCCADAGGSPGRPTLSGDVGARADVGMGDGMLVCWERVKGMETMDRRCVTTVRRANIVVCLSIRAWGGIDGRVQAVQCAKGRKVCCEDSVSGCREPSDEANYMWEGLLRFYGSLPICNCQFNNEL